MSRSSVLVSVAVVLASRGVLQAMEQQIIVVISGEVTTPTAFLLDIETVDGSSKPTPASHTWNSGGMTGAFDVGAGGAEVRDGLLSELGSYHHTLQRAQRAHVGGMPALLLRFWGECPPQQLWVMRDTDAEYTLLEPGASVTLDGISFTCWDPSLGIGTPAGNIPALSGVGLAVMVVALVGVGGVVFGRMKRQAP